MIPWDTTTEGDAYADAFQAEIQREYREWLRLRPVQSVSGPMLVCCNCERQTQRIYNGRCRACQAFWFRTGMERSKEAEAKLVERRKRRTG
jgi:hypothetical protein